MQSWMKTLDYKDNKIFIGWGLICLMQYSKRRKSCQYFSGLILLFRNTGSSFKYLLTKIIFSNRMQIMIKVKEVKQVPILKSDQAWGFHAAGAWPLTCWSPGLGPSRKQNRVVRWSELQHDISRAGKGQWHYQHLNLLFLEEQLKLSIIRAIR